MSRSARRVVLDTAKEAAQNMRNQDYFVKRGQIHWAQFDFETRALAVAIICDDFTILSHRKPGVNSLQLSLEFATLIEDGAEIEIDDQVIDNFTDDAHTILTALCTTQSEVDNIPVSFRLFNDKAIEFHDTDKRVQGLVVLVTVEY